jgi:PTS system ascorbate-specific IIA component
MVAETLKRESVQVIDRVEGWQEAVKAAVSPLVRLGYVEEKYSSEIIENTLMYGVYYMLMPCVALIHGRPEQGALGRQLAVTLIKEPVQFLDKEEPVRLLIAMSAIDSESHIGMLKDVAAVLMDEDRIRSIFESDSEAELYRLFIEPVQVAEDLEK